MSQCFVPKKYYNLKMYDYITYITNRYPNLEVKVNFGKNIILYKNKHYYHIFKKYNFAVRSDYFNDFYSCGEIPQEMIIYFDSEINFNKNKKYTTYKEVVENVRKYNNSNNIV